MNLKLLRNTIINLLDDDDGINSRGHDGIIEICSELGWDDITKKTELQEGKAFIWEKDAHELRKVMVDK